MGMNTLEPIAIVGAGCRFPGGVDSPSSLWQLLREGRDTVRRVPEDRWDAARLKAFQHPVDADRYDRGCFLENDTWAWDPEAFSVPALEAATVDPQHRVLLEVAWEAVEHAGVPVDRLQGSRTGVYVGLYASDNLLRDARPVEDYPHSAHLSGNLPANAAARVAFAMDLRGPVMVVETSCSSGLVAVHTACTALSAGDCDVALAGATSLMPSPETLHLEAEWLLSRSGRCFAFDSRADGYVRGEGAGVVMLKRLDDAVRDDDRILAVIRGSAVNADGRSERLTAPSTMVQRDVLRLAVERAGIDPGEVGLVEAHGPGTPVGDPVEYTSINAVYGRGSGRCALGSIKTNIGHSEPTAGIAGLIKAIECLRRGVVPPNLNFESWNPAIRVDPDSRLFVPTQATSWPVPGGRRLAAVCSYGISGTNAHVVVEQAPTPTSRPSPRRPAAAGTSEPARAFVISATSPKALPLAAERLAGWLAGEGRDTPLADVAHTLALRRAVCGDRLAVVASSRAELIDRLRTFADEGEAPMTVGGRPLLDPEGHGPVLVFTGQGSQWLGMCRRLLDQEPVFAHAIAELEPLIAAEGGFSLGAMLDEPDRLQGVDKIQPVLFAVQVALAALWRSYGITPTAVIGQSLGEVAAAVVAGVLSVADGVAVICRRATLLAGTTGGAMASVLLNVAAVEEEIIAAGADQVSVGVVTSPESTVISGAADQVAALVDRWQARGLVARMVAADVASHSAQMDPILERLRTALAGVCCGPAGAVFYSTVAEDPRDPGPLDADYWVRNQRDTVRFEAACAAALTDGYRLFVECSPHPLAVRAITATAQHHHARDVVAVGSLRRETDDHEVFLTQLGTLHCAGQAIDWASRYGTGALTDVPGTSWNRVRYRKDPPYRLVSPHLIGASQHSLLGGHVHDPDNPQRHLWQTPISPARLPWLADHQVNGVAVLPGAGFVEMMLAAGSTLFDTDQVRVQDVTLAAPLPLEPEPVVTIRATRDAGAAHVEILTTTGDGPLVHASGCAVARPSQPTGNGSPRPGPNWPELTPATFYSQLRQRHQVAHGTAFAGLERIQISPEGEHGMVQLRIPNESRMSAWMMRLHPVLLDEFAQGAIAVWSSRQSLTEGPIVVAGFDTVDVFGPTNHARHASVHVEYADSTTCRASGTLVDADGHVVAEITGLRLANVTPPEQRYQQRLIHQQWVPVTQPTPAAAASQQAWLVLTDGGADVALLVSAALRRRGCEVAMRELTGRGISDVLGDGEWKGVVLAVADHAGSEPPATAQVHVRRACELAGVLADRPAHPRLWIAAHRDGPLATAGLRGVVRTCAYECPELAASLVEVDATSDLGQLGAALLAPSPPVELAWRDGRFKAARLHHGPPASTGTVHPIARPDGSYVISGGLGGLGLLTASWLSQRGAGGIVVVGRSAPSPAAERTLAAIRAHGTSVEVIRGDIADEVVAKSAVHAAEATGKALRGVCHAAGVLDDATIGNITDRALARVWRGKVEGAWALHNATLGRELDWCVLYSSIASQLGSPGQAAHAAANAWLDGLAHWRADHGLPATSIQWGAWSEVGSGQHMAERGIAMLSPTEGVDALERILRAGHTEVGCSPIDISRWLAAYPDAARSSLFSDMANVGDSSDSGKSSVSTALRMAGTNNERREILNDHIIGCVRDILGVTRHITPHTNLVMLGLDSLGAVQLRLRLERSLPITIDQGVLWVKPTTGGLAEWVMESMGHLEPRVQDRRSIASTTKQTARTDQSSAETATADSHGVHLSSGRFHYRAWIASSPTAGSAILLHGLAGDSTSWSRVAPKLAASGINVYALDLRGHGANARSADTSYGLRATADDVEDFIAALRLTSPLLVGHCWGAAVALVLATGAFGQKAPPALSGLVLEELPPTLSLDGNPAFLRTLLTATRSPREELETILVNLHADWHPLDLESNLNGLCGTDPDTVLRVANGDDASRPLLPLLARLTVPTLLLRSDPRCGGLLDETHWSVIKQALPAGSTAHYARSAGHDIHRGSHDLFMSLLARFLHSVSGTDRMNGASPRP